MSLFFHHFEGLMFTDVPTRNASRLLFKHFRVVLSLVWNPIPVLCFLFLNTFNRGGPQDSIAQPWTNTFQCSGHSIYRHSNGCSQIQARYRCWQRVSLSSDCHQKSVCTYFASLYLSMVSDQLLSLEKTSTFSSWLVTSIPRKYTGRT